MAHDLYVSPLQETGKQISDDDLVARLQALCRSSKLFEVEIIDLLVVLQARHLDLPWTYSSLHRFCIERLEMTEGEAARRVAAARVIRRVPALMGYLRAGKLTMTTLLCLANYVTQENVDELLANVASKSKREVRLVLDSREPRSGARVRTSTRATKGGVPLRVELAPGSSAHAKMVRARELMARGGAAIETAQIMEAALDALLGQLEEQVKGPPPAAVAETDGASSGDGSPRRPTERPPLQSPKSSRPRTPLESGSGESRRRGPALAISDQLRRPLGQRRGRPREKTAEDAAASKRPARRRTRRSE